MFFSEKFPILECWIKMHFGIFFLPVFMTWIHIFNLFRKMISMRWKECIAPYLRLLKDWMWIYQQIHKSGLRMNRKNIKSHLCYAGPDSEFNKTFFDKEKARADKESCLFLMKFWSTTLGNVNLSSSRFGV